MKVQWSNLWIKQISRKDKILYQSKKKSITQLVSNTKEISFVANMMSANVTQYCLLEQCAHNSSVSCYNQYEYYHEWYRLLALFATRPIILAKL